MRARWVVAGVSEPHQDQCRRPDQSAFDALIVTCCQQLIDETGADGVSVSVRTGGTVGDLLHATDGVSAALEELQSVIGVGPAHDAYASGAVVEVLDLNEPGALGRWPGFAHEAAATMAVAVLAVPLTVQDSVFGHVELYGRTRRGITLTPVATDVIGTLEDAVLGLFSDDLGGFEGWEPEVAGRPDLYIAAGMVSVQLGVSLVDAVARMCATAFGEQRTLQHLAHEIVSGRRRLAHGDPAG